jgi:hypothetical protein
MAEPENSSGGLTSANPAMPKRGCGVVAGIQNRRSTLSFHRFALVAQRWVFGTWVRRIWVFLALHFNIDTKEKKGEESHRCQWGRTM